MDRTDKPLVRTGQGTSQRDYYEDEIYRGPFTVLHWIIYAVAAWCITAGIVWMVTR